MAAGRWWGGKGLFVELILGGKKITGVLDLPIVSATVIVQGPFTFTFNLSDLPALTPTPLVANPERLLARAQSHTHVAG